MSLYSGKATDHVVFDRLFQAKETCAVSYKNNPGNTGMAKQEEEWRASRKSACEAVQRKRQESPLGADVLYASILRLCFFLWGILAHPGLLERDPSFWPALFLGMSGNLINININIVMYMYCLL
jgi:hypothetical protein